MSGIKIVEDEFGLTKQPPNLEEQSVRRFTISNGNGISVQVSFKDKESARSVYY